MPRSRETRDALTDRRHDPGVASGRFATTADLLSFLDSDLRPGRTAIIERLSHPALTGLTHNELYDLTQRLAARQAAQAERFGHQRRGGPRQPGARGGIAAQVEQSFGDSRWPRRTATSTLARAPGVRDT
jgi:hypothetical protein